MNPHALVVVSALALQAVGYGAEGLGDLLGFESAVPGLEQLVQAVIDHATLGGSCLYAAGLLRPLLKSVEKIQFASFT